MSKPSFVATPEEVEYFNHQMSRMVNNEGLYIAWLVDPKALEEMVPAPLKPAGPLVMAYISEMGSNFSQRYREAALIVPVTYGDQSGSILPEILLTDAGGDNAMFAGRGFNGMS